VDPARDVLEVTQLLGDTILERRTFLRGADVVIGARTGHRWRLWGRDMGWVTAGAGAALRASPPILSDVEEAWMDDFQVPAIAGGSHTLVRGHAEGWELIPPGDTQSCAITDHQARVVQIDTMTFVIRRVAPSPRAVSEVIRDTAFLGMSSALSVVFVWWGLIMQGTQPTSAGETTPGLRDVDFTMMLQTPPPEPPTKAIEEATTANSKSSGTSAKASKAKPGGTTSEAPSERAGGSDAVKPWERFQNSGLTAGLASDLIGGITELIGVRGTHQGGTGLGARGPGGLGGPGGPGGDWGNGPRGAGIGGPGGPGVGPGALAKTTRTTSEPTVAAESFAQAGGGLSAAQIDAVVKRRLSQIRYCYSRELQRKPDLSGKVSIRFTIAKDGSVSQASVKSTSLNSAPAEQCMVQRFYQMTFPEPKGAGIVLVTYPFTFQSGGTH
jgi:hypothetical protein